MNRCPDCGQTYEVVHKCNPFDVAQAKRPAPNKKQGGLLWAFIFCISALAFVMIVRQEDKPTAREWVIRSPFNDGTYFQKFAKANNELGIKGVWTSKASAKRFSKEEGQKAAMELQHIADTLNQNTGSKLIVGIEPAD